MILYAALRDASRGLQEISEIYVHYCFYRHSISQERVLHKFVDEALAQAAPECKDCPKLSVEHQ